MLKPLANRSAIRFTGYCPQLCCVTQAMLEILCWAARKKARPIVDMSTGVMLAILRKRRHLDVCRRTVAYGWKRLVLEGFISRQSRWKKLTGGAIERDVTRTRLKGLFPRAWLRLGQLGLELAALADFHGREEVVQKIALGVENLIGSAVPPAPVGNSGS